MIRSLLLVALVVAPLHSGRAQASEQSIPARATAWWHAFTVGDTAYLRQHSASRLALTLSSGAAFDQATMLPEAATHHPSASYVMKVLSESLLTVTPTMAVTMSRVSESTQNGSNTYRYVTVLERRGGDWHVAVAQSTRELTPTPRVAASVVGSLADFAGTYRGPRGGQVQVTVRDSVLQLTDPSGSAVTLEPIGPGLFELPALYDVSLVRFLFTRDATGRVSSFSRLIYGSVATFTRTP